MQEQYLSESLLNTIIIMFKSFGNGNNSRADCFTANQKVKYGWHFNDVSFYVYLVHAIALEI